MNPAYSLHAVGFSYGGPDEVLQVDALEFPGGRVIALVGPNGSGKSTLLHLLAFLAVPSRGELQFFGTPVRPEHVRTLRRRVGFLLQNPYLFHSRVADNVDWGLRMRGFPEGERRRRTAQALEQVGLDGYGGRSAQALSGGEAQRLALARLLALEPEVILLDEPTNHLDRETRARIEATLLAWVQERQTTVVIATHDVSQAHRLGAQVWQMESGRLRLGEQDNVFRGRLVEGAPGTFDTGKLKLRISPPPTGAQMVRISPRQVLLAREALVSSALNSLRGTVVRAELSGPDELHVILDCGEPLAVVVTRESWQKLALTVGQEAFATFKASAVHPG